MAQDRKRTLFFEPMDMELAEDISIRSPEEFRESIKKVEKGGVTTKEKRGLVLAKNRAGAQLKRKNLSPKERRAFTEISKTRLPKVTKKKKNPDNIFDMFDGDSMMDML